MSFTYHVKMDCECGHILEVRVPYEGADRGVIQGAIKPIARAAFEREYGHSPTYYKTRLVHDGNTGTHP